MATNTLTTVLDDASGRLLVEKYLVEKFLERRDFDTVMANSQFAQKFRLPAASGTYVEMTRKNRLRMPQKVSNSSPTSDPASGALLAGEKVKLPLEAIQEYVGIGTIATWTSWIDLEEWAKDDMPMALRRRMHQLTQNCFKVGRYTPGVWAVDGTASTAFDTTVDASPTIEGVSFTFASAPAFYVGGKGAFNSIAPGDRATMADFERMHAKMKLAGAPMIGRRYVAVISDSMKQDLMRDDEYFATAVHAWNGKGISENQVADYKGWHFLEDDEPFTEGYAAEGVRATNGPIHSAFCFGKGAFGYLKLGGKESLRPRFKVQDITKTGVEFTIGYAVPFQVGIANADWCWQYMAPVSEWEPNNA